MMDDLLPASASRLERALDGLQARLTHLDVRLADLWNPHSCPAKFLPFLAASLSLDHWDSDWPIEDKRGAIAAAMRVHAHKGTRGAVQDALAGLGIEARIIEWFETPATLARGTFALQLAARPARSGRPGQPMDGPRQARALGAAHSAKRESQHMRMGIEARFASRLGLAAGFGAEQSASLTGPAAGRRHTQVTMARRLAGHLAAHDFSARGVMRAARQSRMARSSALGARAALAAGGVMRASRTMQLRAAQIMTGRAGLALNGVMR